MTPRETWSEILRASGLEDWACEVHRHDLLDGLGGSPDAPLGDAFVRLRGLGRPVEEILRSMREIPGGEKLRLPDDAAESLARKAEDERGGRIRGITHFTSAQRGTYQETWGSPDLVLDLVRGLFGKIDLDLASSWGHNERVRAARFYSAQDPCPLKPDATPGEVVFCNPPGPCRNVALFWAAWNLCISGGARGAFLIFNLDHWRQLYAPVRDLPVAVLRKRLRFVGALGGASFPSALVLSDGEPPKEAGHLAVWRAR